MPPSLMSDSGSSTATTSGPATPSTSSLVDSASTSKASLPGWLSSRKSPRRDAGYAGTGTAHIATARDVEAALALPSAADPAYAAAVLGAYVEAKRNRGLTRADISLKLGLIERRMPRFAPASLAVRRQHGLRVTPELEALAGVTEDEDGPRRDGRVRRLVGAGAGDAQWVELVD
ncbi:hypothetical protein Q8F55_008330 [Vanrija albida]|uniref:Uncharacterized protein n=1 Tax=Vanrija albida TaxID=181172 RepID=A0ABR3PW31_9TREE